MAVVIKNQSLRSNSLINADNTLKKHSSHRIERERLMTAVLILSMFVELSINSTSLSAARGAHHCRRGADCAQGVGHEIHRYKIRDTVDKRLLGDQSPQMLLTLLSGKQVYICHLLNLGTECLNAV